MEELKVGNKYYKNVADVKIQHNSSEIKMMPVTNEKLQSIVESLQSSNESSKYNDERLQLVFEKLQSTIEKLKRSMIKCTAEIEIVKKDNNSLKDNLIKILFSFHQPDNSDHNWPQNL